MVIVSTGNFSFSHMSLSSGVLKGSLLRPTCFSIYMLPLRQNIRSYGISCHCHANATQLFLSVDINDRKQIDSLLKKTLSDLKTASNVIYVQLNADKPEVMILGC